VSTSNNKGVYAVLVTLLLVVFIAALLPVKAHDEGGFGSAFDGYVGDSGSITINDEGNIYICV